MACVHLRFTRNKSLVSRLIRFFCWSDYSHVEIVLSNGYLGSLGDGGVAIRPFDYAPDDEYVYRFVDCTIAQRNLVIDFADKQIGKPYDWTGVIGCGLHRDWHERKAWFCSELVVASFEWAGIQLIREPVNRVTPGMLLECEEVRP